MRHFFLLLVVVSFFSVQALATVRTVSNNPTNLAQFNTIQAAIDASSGDDTIQVHGSPYTYPNFTIADKRLTIIGPGFAPDKDFGHRATVAQGTIGGAGSANTVIQGMRFLEFRVNEPFPSGLQFIRNYFDAGAFAPNPRSFLFSGTGTCKNYLFESNAFNCFSLFAENPSFENILFRNNYFHVNRAFLEIGIIRRFTNCTNVVFDHNFWMGPSANPMVIFSENSRFLTLSNNIFLHMNAGANNSGSYFNNNITFESANNTPWLSNGNTDGGSNIADADPQMAAQSAANAGTFDPVADYTIADGPANNAGSDGKDLGLLYDQTGSYNWAKCRNSLLPRVVTMQLPNPAIPVGGTLEVNLKAVKAN